MTPMRLGVTEVSCRKSRASPVVTLAMAMNSPTASGHGDVEAVAELCDAGGGVPAGVRDASEAGDPQATTPTAARRVTNRRFTREAAGTGRRGQSATHRAAGRCVDP